MLQGRPCPAGGVRPPPPNPHCDPPGAFLLLDMGCAGPPAWGDCGSPRHARLPRENEVFSWKHEVSEDANHRAKGKATQICPHPPAQPVHAHTPVQVEAPARPGGWALPATPHCCREWAALPMPAPASALHSTGTLLLPVPVPWGQQEVAPSLESGAPSPPPSRYTQINHCPFSAQCLGVSWPEGTVTTQCGHLMPLPRKLLGKGNAGSWVFSRWA